ncbi:MAG: FkbM family methyltransferase [Rhodospirillales bacterium]|nr:FkbM family methyltransferase [Rhodospirillales bacterium]
MTDNLQTYVAKKLPFEPFTLETLPLLSRLQLIGFHIYRNRWAKRLGKKPGRMLFDFAYQVLGLSGQGKVSFSSRGESKQFVFEARKLHFSRLFNNEIINVCEPELATFLEAFLTGDKVFYDIGSNWGYFSLYASALPNYNGPIHAFEPIKDTFADLQSWVSQTGLENRVNCHNIAVSDADGTAQMGVFPDDSGMASLEKVGDSGTEQHEVQTFRLDSLDHPKPDFIKLDVEGFETEVMAGGMDVLTTAKSMLMFENWAYHDDHERTLRPIKKLQDCGYKLFVPMWWAGAPTNKLVWPEAHEPFPEGPKLMAYVPFDIEQRFALRSQINFICCHQDRLSELENIFDVMD